jgi:UDP-4-amino-4-deoxy-L-arabinose-oxoglutarate aminotransferase
MLPVSRPSLGREELAAVKAVLDSGWLASGPRCRELEEKVAALSGVAHGVAFMSATDGLFLTLKAKGIGPGDEVVVPSYTFAATANTVVHCGAKPVFADIDRRTLNISPEDAARRITPRTRALVPVHFAGAPCDMDRLLRLAKSRGLFVMADAAHALGAEYKGRPVGRCADASVYSFHPMKNITTAEGGMLVTDDGGLAARALRLRFHGIAQEAWAREEGAAPARTALEPGYKSNLPDLLAAVGVAQLRRLKKNNARRRVIVGLYARRLAEAAVPGVEVPPGPRYEHVSACHVMIVLVDFPGLGADREDFIRRMAAERIGCGVHYVAVHLHPYYRSEHPVPRGSLPETEYVSARTLTLPLFPDMEDSDVDDVVAALARVVDGYRR